MQEKFKERMTDFSLRKLSLQESQLDRRKTWNGGKDKDRDRDKEKEKEPGATDCTANQSSDYLINTSNKASNNNNNNNNNSSNSNTSTSSSSSSSSNGDRAGNTSSKSDKAVSEVRLIPLMKTKLLDSTIPSSSVSSHSITCSTPTSNSASTPSLPPTPGRPILASPEKSPRGDG